MSYKYNKEKNSLEKDGKSIPVSGEPKWEDGEVIPDDLFEVRKMTRNVYHKNTWFYVPDEHADLYDWAYHQTMDVAIPIENKEDQDEGQWKLWEEVRNIFIKWKGRYKANINSISELKSQFIIKRK